MDGPMRTRFARWTIRNMKNSKTNFVATVDMVGVKIQKLKMYRTMKRRSRFLTGLLSAVMTFGILSVTVGTDHWERYNHYHHGYYHHDPHDQYDDTGKSKQESDVDTDLEQG